MQLGCHVSISGSIDKAVDNAVERKCSAFQIFTRNPRGWNAKKLTDIDISNFKSIRLYANAKNMANQA